MTEYEVIINNPKIMNIYNRICPVCGSRLAHDWRGREYCTSCRWLESKDDIAVTSGDADADG